MATAFDVDNLFNLAETAAVATINADTWLAANVTTVHEKVRLGVNVQGWYTEEELPAIGVLCVGADADALDGVHGFEVSVLLIVDIWTADFELNAAASSCNTIAAHSRELFRIQRQAPGVNSDSSQLDTFLADGEISVGAMDFDIWESEDGGGWLANITYQLDLQLLRED